MTHRTKENLLSLLLATQLVAVIGQFIVLYANGALGLYVAYFVGCWASMAAFWIVRAIRPRNPEAIRRIILIGGTWSFADDQVTSAKQSPPPLSDRSVPAGD